MRAPVPSIWHMLEGRGRRGVCGCFALRSLSVSQSRGGTCSHAAFAKRIEDQTKGDREAIEGKLGRSLRDELARIGVAQLRSFMEEVLKRLYRKELPELIGKIEQRAKDKVRVHSTRTHRVGRCTGVLLCCHPRAHGCCEVS